MTTETTSLQQISAISLFVEDLPGAKSFYQDVFEAAVLFEDRASVAFKFGNVIINLLRADQACNIVEPGAVAGPDTGSRFQLSIWVENVDAVCEQLQKRGVTLLSGPKDRPWGMRTANFVDPAGHSWEVAQATGG